MLLSNYWNKLDQNLWPCSCLVAVVTTKGWVWSLLDFMRCIDTTLPPLTQVLNAQPFIAFLLACAVLIVLPIIQELGNGTLAPAQVYKQKSCLYIKMSLSLPSQLINFWGKKKNRRKFMSLSPPLYSYRFRQ